MRPNILQYSGFDIHARKTALVYGLLDWTDISRSTNGYSYSALSEDDRAVLGGVAGQYMETNTFGVQLDGMQIDQSTLEQNTYPIQKLYARFRLTSKVGTRDWSTRTICSANFPQGLDNYVGPSVWGTTGRPCLISSTYDGGSSVDLPDGPNYPASSLDRLSDNVWYDLQYYVNSTTGFVRCVFTPLEELGIPIILEGIAPGAAGKIWNWGIGRAVFDASGWPGYEGAAFECDWDDVFLTDGAEGPGDHESTGLDNKAFLRAAVYASGMHAYYASDYSEFRLWGHLLLDQDNTVKAFQHPQSRPPVAYSGNEGPNYANVTRWDWETNPVTGALLTEADIKGWGLCGQVINYKDAGDLPSYEWTPNREGLRLSAACLALVKTSDRGQPYVQPVYASPARYIKGKWKPHYLGDPVSVTSLLKQFPTRTSERNDMGYPGLTLREVGDPSCISFPFTAAPKGLGFGLTFSEEYRVDYRDWGENFKSYFITGYNLAAGASRKFQDNYTTVSWENVPNGGAYFQHIWDYSTSPYTGQWQPTQQIYKTKVSYSHGLSKLKARGSGRSLQMKVTSEDQKNFAINGWIMDISGNAK